MYMYFSCMSYSISIHYTVHNAFNTLKCHNKFEEAHAFETIFIWIETTYDEFYKEILLPYEKRRFNGQVFSSKRRQPCLIKHVSSV